jgi:hypothetical protein
MLVGAALLVAGVGASALWIAVISVGLSMVAVDRFNADRAGGHG